MEREFFKYHSGGTDGIITYEKDRVGSIVLEQNWYRNKLWMARMFIQHCLVQATIFHGNSDGCLLEKVKGKYMTPDLGQCKEAGEILATTQRPTFIGC